MRVLVTGAAGTLGRAVLPRLRASGRDVVALDLHRGDGDAEWIEGDVRDRDRPEHDVGRWLDELRRRPDEVADSDPPWP